MQSSGCQIGADSEDVSAKDAGSGVGRCKGGRLENEEGAVERCALDASRPRRIGGTERTVG